MVDEKTSPEVEEPIEKGCDEKVEEKDEKKKDKFKKLKKLVEKKEESEEDGEDGDEDEEDDMEDKSVDVSYVDGDDFTQKLIKAVKAELEPIYAKMEELEKQTKRIKKSVSEDVEKLVDSQLALQKAIESFEGPLAIIKSVAEQEDEEAKTTVKTKDSESVAKDVEVLKKAGIDEPKDVASSKEIHNVGELISKATEIGGILSVDDTLDFYNGSLSTKRVKEISEAVKGK